MVVLSISVFTPLIGKLYIMKKNYHFAHSNYYSYLKIYHLGGNIT